MFQMTFARDTHVCSGATAGTDASAAYLVHHALVHRLLRPKLSNWVWGGGWIGRVTLLDFAGGNVHISAGVSAVVCAIMLGRRIDPAVRSSPMCRLSCSAGGCLVWLVVQMLG